MYVTESYVSTILGVVVYFKESGIPEKSMIVNRQKPLAFIVSNVIILLTCCSNATAGFSKEKVNEKLNELYEVSKPKIPIYGPINEPIKAGVSLFQYAGAPIEIEKKENEIHGTIKLPDGQQEGIAELHSRRKELQQVEEEGLNFIQPSLALTKDEQKSIDEFFSRNEQEQLLNLWKSTIERNKTIQFIIQKLSPANAPQQGNSLLSRTLGAAIFLPFYALQAFTSNSGAYLGSQVGSRVLGSVIEGKMQKNQAQLQLSQTEAIILFMMTDEIAERLRQRYHAYKRLMTERTLATVELDEAKKDSLDAHELNLQEAEILANIQRRAVEREIRKLDAQIRSHRNALIELTGPKAVNELDEQLKIELAAAENTPLDF